MINLFYKNYTNKLIATFSIINAALLIARLVVKLNKPVIKKKHDYLTKTIFNKQGKNRV